MWIGDSMLFMWIDSHLRADPQQRKDVAGVTWLIHGGGYYHLEKRLLVPGRLPPTLRWFWLEATTTWLSGFLLLILIYYMSADAFMLDRSLNDLSTGQAVGAGVLILAAGWFFYDVLWRSSVRHRPALAAALSLVLFVAISYVAARLLSPRAAFIHIGAMLGTIMAANVWVHIIPPQRKMVQAARAGREIDYSLGVHAKTRSTHNTYLTFPAIFLMISVHFPALFTAPRPWLVLTLLLVAGALIRHLMLVAPAQRRWAGVAAVASAAALVYLTTQPHPESPRAGEAAPPFVEVRTVIVQRCAVCHSTTPTVPNVSAMPGGVAMDTPAQIRAAAPRIKVRAVDQKTMPPANTTRISERERETLRQWIDAGTPLR